MTLDDLDRLLSQWKARLDTAAQNLADLRSRPVYDILAGSQRLQLTGITEQKLGQAVAVLDGVWSDYSLLCSALDRAADLRRQVSRFTLSPDKLRAIDAILNGPAVSASGTQSSLEQLFSQMNARFAAGRSALMEIDANWTRLNTELAPVNALLDAHRTELAAGVPELRAAVQALRPRVMADPLGANDDFDTQVLPLYTKVRAAFEKLQAQRRNLRTDLETARALLKSLPGLHEQSQEVFREFREKIAGRKATEPALDSHRITQLEAQVSHLERRSQGPDMDAACAELEHCLADIEDLIARERQVLARNLAALELRRELRGRLSAFKAKAVARQRAEDPKLTELARRASELLYARPTPLDDALNLVTEYGRASL